MVSALRFSRLDHQARQLAESWGLNLSPITVLKPASPCGRRYCGGSGLGRGCMLCARDGGRPDFADMERELARETGLLGLAKAVLD